MQRLSVSLEQASAELTSGLADPLRGEIDLLDPARGIGGWAIDLTAPDHPVSIELFVGEAFFGTVATSLDRPEIDQTLGVASHPGFLFDTDVFARLARLSPSRADHPVTLRFADGGPRLAWPGSVPSVCDLVGAWTAWALAAIAPTDPGDGKGERLLARLSHLRTEAEAFRAIPLYPTSAGEVGHIDAVHMAAEGQVWFQGWMKRGIANEFSAIVVDRQKFPAGVSLARYERQDLASSFVGVVGLIDTGWAPPAQVKEFFLHLGTRGGLHLKGDAHTRLVRGEAFLSAFAQIQTVATDGNTEGLASVLTAGSGWMPGNAAAAGIATEASLDRLYLIPGFGCLAEGWVVSPAKKVRTFHVKIGDCILASDDAATYFKPRPDLQQSFGCSAGVAARAGFVTVLRGAPSASAVGHPLLRIVHEDGGAVVMKIDPKALQILDPIADGADVLRLYPSIHRESFFPALAAATERALARTRRTPDALALAACRRAVVVRLPLDRSALRLVMDGVGHALARLPEETGIAFVASRTQARTEAALLFEELAAATSVPLSLFLVDDQAAGFDGLSEVLHALGADRFVHLGPGVHPTAAGWSAIAASLVHKGHGIDWFEIVDEYGSPDRVEGSLGADAFGWSRAALIGWRLEAPRLVQGTWRDAGLPPPLDLRPAHPGCALRIERRLPSRFAELIDARLLEGKERARRDA